MKNVLGYIRVSTIGQVKEGYSLGEQKDEIERFCEANSFNLLEIFRDEGRSGAKTDEDETRIDRDGLIDMLNRLKAGGYRLYRCFVHKQIMALRCSKNADS